MEMLPRNRTEPESQTMASVRNMTRRNKQKERVYQGKETKGESKREAVGWKSIRNDEDDSDTAFIKILTTSQALG